MNVPGRNSERNELSACRMHAYPDRIQGPSNTEHRLELKLEVVILCAAAVHCGLPRRQCIYYMCNGTISWSSGNGENGGGEWRCWVHTFSGTVKNISSRTRLNGLVSKKGELNCLDFFEKNFTSMTQLSN